MGRFILAYIVLMSVILTQTARAAGPDRPSIIYSPLVLTAQSVPGVEGATFKAFPYHSLLNDTDNAVFLGAFRYAWEPSGIFRSSRDGISLVTANGQHAPGMSAGAQFLSFDQNFLRVNDAGQVAFEAWLTGPGIRDTGADDTNACSNWLWTNGQLLKIAQWRTLAPGTNTVFRTFGGTALGEDGQVLFAGELVPDSRSGIWYGKPGNIQPIVLEGQPAPGTGGLFYGTQSLLDLPTIARNGSIAFFSALAGPGAPPDPYRHDKVALFVGKPGDFRPVAMLGQQAPGSNTTYSDFHGARINSREELVLFATLANHEYGIFAGAADNMHLVAKTTDLAPGADGAKFNFFDRLGINDRGDVLFMGDIATGDDSTYGLWAGRPDRLKLIALQGQPAPETGDGVFFDRPRGPVINKDGQVAFYALLTGPNSRGPDDYGLFATRHNGQLRLIARYGDRFQVAPGDIRTIAPLFSSSSWASDVISFNEDSDLSFPVRFTDGSEGIFLARVLPEPSALLLLLAACAGILRPRRSRACPDSLLKQPR